MSTKQIQQNQDFTTFVKEIKNKILSSQYEKLQALFREIGWFHKTILNFIPQGHFLRAIFNAE